MQALKKCILSFVFAGLLPALLPTLSLADSLSYNYLKGNLCFYPSATDQDFIGMEFQGSYLLTPEIFAFGGLQYLTDDVNLTAGHVGAAYRYGIDEATDVYGGLTLEHQDFDGNVDDTAIGLRGGIRHILDPGLEVGGQLRVVTGDFDYVGLRGTARYFLKDNMSLVAELDLYDGELGLMGGISCNFL